MSVRLSIPGRNRTKGTPSPKRYLRKGDCLQCGWCCLKENCEYLLWDGDKAICSIYKTDFRPERCKNFPQAPPILNPKCGYYFLDRWENDKVVKFGSDL